MSKGCAMLNALSIIMIAIRVKRSHQESLTFSLKKNSHGNESYYYYLQEIVSD